MDRKQTVSRGPKRRLHVTSVAAFLAVAVLSLSSSTALGSCIPGRANAPHDGFDGGSLTPSNFPIGIKADILEYDPYVTPGSASLSWSMLFNGNQWAQIGWWKDANRHVFVQVTQQSGGQLTFFYAAQTVGTTHNYEVDYVSAAHRYDMYRDGVVVLQFTASWWVPSAYQVDGETLRWSDQMPGTPTGHMVFTNMQDRLNGGSWVAWDGIVGSNSAFYAFNRIGPGRMEIWDTCTH